jgi:hypothetical protein
MPPSADAPEAVEHRPEACVSMIFGKLALPATCGESRRVLAALLYLRS